MNSDKNMQKMARTQKMDWVNKTGKMKIAYALFFASILFLQLLQLPRLAYAYNADFQEDIKDIKIRLSENRIGTKNIDSYMEKITAEVKAENDAEADKLFDEMRKYADKMLGMHDNLTALIGDARQLDDDIARKDIEKTANEGLFELGMENQESAMQLLNLTERKTFLGYELARNKTIDDIAKLGKNTSNIASIIDYGLRLNSSQFEKIINFRKEAMDLMDADNKIRDAALLKEEYRKISEGKRFESGIEEMNMNFELGKYAQVASTYLDLKQALAYANRSFVLIAYARKENYTSYSQSASHLINQSVEEYKNERYSESLGLIEQAISAGEKEKSRQALISDIRTNFINKAYDYTDRNKWTISIVLIGTLAFMVIKYPKLAKSYRRFQKDMLEKKADSLTESIKKIQNEHYIQKKMSKKMYEFKLAKCQKEIIRTKERIALIPEENEQETEVRIS